MRRYSPRNYSIIGIIYLVVGLIVAGNRQYLVDLNSLQNIVSAVLAIVLWPLLFLGVDLHLQF